MVFQSVVLIILLVLAQINLTSEILSFAVESAGAIGHSILVFGFGIWDFR
jgi:membrane-bound ClpP family serine protease